jgi:TonB family protein
VIEEMQNNPLREPDIQLPNAGIETPGVIPLSERLTIGLFPEEKKVPLWMWFVFAFAAPMLVRRPKSFLTSLTVNGLILALMLILGVTAKKVLDQHRYEETLLVLPAKPAPPPPKVKMPPPPKIEELPRPVDVKLEAPRIDLPKPEPKPDLKPIQVEVKVPVIDTAKLKVIEGPQPKQVLNIDAKQAVVTAQQTKNAMSAAAMPAQNNNVKFSTKPVHFGETFGVTPNPNAKGPATVAAIGNPYGGMQGPAIAPHGKVGSTGFGNGSRVGSDSGVVGKVASAGIKGNTVAAPTAGTGKVASVGITAAPTAVAQAPRAVTGPPPTDLVVVYKPQPQYTSEAKQLRVQGDVILRVTFAADGHIVVQGIVHGLGHGLDEEARRVAQQIRFRPPTRNGQAVDITTNITITFQLA